MSAYIVFIREKTVDQTELDFYSNNLAPAMTGFNFNLLAAYGPQVVLEGPAVEGVVILEFPSVQEAETWYNSPGYQELAQHRFNGAVYTGVIVDGVKQQLH